MKSVLASIRHPRRLAWWVLCLALMVAAIPALAVDEEENKKNGDFPGPSLFLRGGYSDDFSAWNPIIYPTTLHAMGEGRVLYLTGAGITPTIEGLRITGGVGDGGFSGDTYDAGGGVYVSSGVQAVISGCWVYSNTAHVGVSPGSPIPGIGAHRRGRTPCLYPPSL